MAKYSDPQEAGGQLIILDVQSGASTPLAAPYSSFGSLSVNAGKLVTVAGSPTLPSEVALLELPEDPAAAKPGDWSAVQKSLKLEVSAALAAAVSSDLPSRVKQHCM